MSQIYKNGASVPIGPGIVQTLEGNSGGKVSPDGTGNISTLGTGSITVVGNPGGNSLTTQLTGITNHAVQIGAGTATLTQLVGTNNTALLGHTGSDPTFGQIPNSVLVNSSITVTSPDGSISVVGSPVSLGGTVQLEVNAGAPYISLSPYIVGTDVHSGYSTIAAAYAAAVGSGVGANVYIKPKLDGTPYTENLTLTGGVNLVAFGGQVTIVGKLSMSTAGTVYVQGIKLQTNSDNFLAVTGSAASIVNLNNCYLNCTNNTGISYSSSSGSSKINVFDCQGDLGTTGIGIYNSTSGGVLMIKYCSMTNTGSSSTASSMAGGTLNISHSDFSFVFSSSSSTVGTFENVRIQSATNTACLALTGTSNFLIQHGYYSSGTASAITIGVGTTATVVQCSCVSSNTNVLTGAGTMIYGGIVFGGSSSGHNVTTETPLATLN